MRRSIEIIAAFCLFWSACMFTGPAYSDGTQELRDPDQVWRALVKGKEVEWSEEQAARAFFYRSAETTWLTQFSEKNQKALEKIDRWHNIARTTIDILNIVKTSSDLLNGDLFRRNYANKVAAIMDNAGKDAELAAMSLEYSMALKAKSRETLINAMAITSFAMGRVLCNGDGCLNIANPIDSLDPNKREDQKAFIDYVFADTTSSATFNVASKLLFDYISEAASYAPEVLTGNLWDVLKNFKGSSVEYIASEAAGIASDVFFSYALGRQLDMANSTQFSLEFLRHYYISYKGNSRDFSVALGILPDSDLYKTLVAFSKARTAGKTHTFDEWYGNQGVLDTLFGNGYSIDNAYAIVRNILKAYPTLGIRLNLNPALPYRGADFYPYDETISAELEYDPYLGMAGEPSLQAVLAEGVANQPHPVGNRFDITFKAPGQYKLQPRVLLDGTIKGIVLNGDVGVSRYKVNATAPEITRTAVSWVNGIYQVNVDIRLPTSLFSTSNNDGPITRYAISESSPLSVYITLPGMKELHVATLTDPNIRDIDFDTMKNFTAGSVFGAEAMSKLLAGKNLDLTIRYELANVPDIYINLDDDTKEATGLLAEHFRLSVNHASIQGLDTIASLGIQIDDPAAAGYDTSTRTITLTKDETLSLCLNNGQVPAAALTDTTAIRLGLTRMDTPLKEQVWLTGTMAANGCFAFIAPDSGRYEISVFRVVSPTQRWTLYPSRIISRVVGVEGSNTGTGNGDVGGGTPTAPAPLNDTGITWSGHATDGNAATCDPAHPAGQDCQYGRDAAAAQGKLTKVGGGSAGFDFTALDASGNPTTPSSGANPHPCVRDNVTGLVWEVKTADGSLRDQGWTYTWYHPSSPDGNPGTASGGNCKTTGRCDTEKYVADVNAAGLCGHNDWRMPTVKELEGIADLGRALPAIDPTYFPNTPSSYFWSGSPVADSLDNAWFVDVSNGSANFSAGNRGNGWHVRLVRGGQ